MQGLMRPDSQGAMVQIKDAAFPNPFVSGLEYGAPARGPWNIVHLGMLIPESHQVFVCAQGCLRGVVLTAAEMGALDRFSTVTIEESNVLSGDMEQLLVEGVSQILNSMPHQPRAVLVFTSCIHHFIACDLPLVYGELRQRFPHIDFTDCYMTPILRKSISPDALMRRQMYSLLKPLPKEANRVNIIGSALPLAAGAELKALLQKAGYLVGELPACRTYEQYLNLARASLNISFIPAAIAAGEELAARLGQKHLYLPLSYDYAQISDGLRRLAQELSLPPSDWGEAIAQAEAALAEARTVVGSLPIVIDYTATTRPLGLARLLLEHGFTVQTVYADSFHEEDQADFVWLQQHAPDLAVCATVHAKSGLLAQTVTQPQQVLAIGQKAAYFSGTQHFVNLVEGGGLYGFDGIVKLAALMIQATLTAQDTKEIVQVKGWGCCG